MNAKGIIEQGLGEALASRIFYLGIGLDALDAQQKQALANIVQDFHDAVSDLDLGATDKVIVSVPLPKWTYITPLEALQYKYPWLRVIPHPEYGCLEFTGE